MADENDTGSNLIWAIAMIIIVAIIAGALIMASKGNFFGGGTKKVDINVTTPASK